jgi:hypothetical protein
VIIGGSVKSVGKKFLHDDGNCGDLYRLCSIDYFGEEIQEFPYVETDSLQNADIITFGDSFFLSRLDSHIFATELQRQSGYTVYNVNNGVSEYYEDPLYYLSKVDFTNDERKTLILEVAERYSIKNSQLYHRVYTPKTPIGKRLGNWGTILRLARPLYVSFLKLKNSVPQKEDINHFFRNNVVIFPLINLQKEFKFRFLKEIDHRIGDYSHEPEMLFFHESVEFNRTQKSEADMERLAERIQQLSDTLKKKYNIDLIYVIIPNKFSIYADYLPNYEYDNFIPQINHKLREKGIKTIDIYDKYLEYRNGEDSELLYYVSDTHYTPLGKKILVDETMRVLSDNK